MAEIVVYVMLGLCAAYLLGWGVWRLVKRKTSKPGERMGYTIPDAVALLGVVVLLVGFAGSFLQAQLGLWGLVLTEVLILLAALVAGRLTKANFREMFSLRRPRLRAVIGGVLLWYGTLQGVGLLSQLLLRWFPAAYGTVDALSDFMTDGSMALSLLAVGVLPALCEEALHRGAILSAFRGRRSTAITVFWMALLFGFFHLDLYRFPLTALLGAALTYAGIASGSIFVPVLMHFLNNAVSVVSLYLVDGASSAGSTILSVTTFEGLLTSAVGVVSIAVFSFALVLAGILLLREKGSPFPGRAMAYLGVALALVTVLAVGSAYISFRDAAQVTEKDGFQTAFTFGDMTGNQDSPVEFTRDGTLHVTLEAICGDGNYTFRLMDPTGKTILYFEGREIHEDCEVPVTRGIWRFAYTVEPSEGKERATDGSFSLSGVLE